MAAPKGNHYGKNQGRPKNIPTPEKMWEYFTSYKEETKNNPIEKKVLGNKGYVVSDEKLQRPLTLEGFENWCCENEIITDISDYFENKDDRYRDFVPICALIRRKVRQDQIEGGMVGIYNSSITQRLNNLVEKTETIQKTINVKFDE